MRKLALPSALVSLVLVNLGACAEATIDPPATTTATRKDASVSSRDASKTPQGTEDSSAVDNDAGDETVPTDPNDPTDPTDAGQTPEPTDAGIDASKDAGIDASVGVDASTNDAGACPSNITNGVLVTYDLTGEPGNQGSSPPTTQASGLFAGDILRAPSLTVVSGAGSINSSNWASSATADTSKYYTITLTPDPRCTLSLASLSVDTKASSTGPAKVSVATSADNFAAKTDITPNVVATPAVTVSQTKSAVEIRIYGYSASQAGGTFRLQNALTVTGSLK